MKPLTQTGFSPSAFEEKVERLIRVSIQKPLLPEEFVPWEDPMDEADKYLPQTLTSLHGHPLWDTLSPEAQVELGKMEVVQSMYSYAWSETLACLFFNRHLLTLSPDSVEHRFLLRELIEECRHQEMFSRAIRTLGLKPVEPTRLHRFFGNLTVRYLPAPAVFMSVMSIELMADIYAKHIRKDPEVYSVLRKCSELHHIEEGRHIVYTEMWLEKFTAKAGFFRSTLYSFVVLFNLYFMRTLYVKQEFFERLGVENPKAYHKAASANLAKKFPDVALTHIIEFVSKFNGFNFITKPFWRRIMKVKL
ncbi:MAG: diiron oxygenase [Flavobacteriia bacterium]|nr:diiron oxygenase [Flavobacteriia bacterium]